MYTDTNSCKLGINYIFIWQQNNYIAKNKAPVIKSIYTFFFFFGFTYVLYRNIDFVIAKKNKVEKGREKNKKEKWMKY